MKSSKLANINNENMESKKSLKIQSIEFFKDKFMG